MRASVVLLSVVLVAAAASCGGDPPLKTPTQFFVGYAEADVTPPVGTIMGGYGPPGGYRKSTGTHDPIKFQLAIIANDAPQALVYATMDTVGFFHDFGDWGPGLSAVRKAIVKQIGHQFRLKPEHIVIASTHSHSGPDLTGFWQQNNQGPDLAYLQTLLAAIPQVAKQAADSIQPGTVHYAMTDLPDYTGFAEDCCGGVVDTSVAILQARNASGSPVFTIANWAKHPTSLGSSNTLFSADFIWGFREEMLIRTGAPAMFMQGAIAAIHGGSKGSTGTDEWDSTYNMGSIVADTVEAALPSLQQSVSVEIRHAYATPTCQMKSELIKTFRENAGIPQRYMSYAGADDKEMWVNEVPISWHQVGDAEFVSYPGEATPQLAFLAKDHMVSPYKFVMGLGNDEIGYLIDKDTLSWDTAGRLESYELTMGMGDDSGQCVWDAHTQLGWFDGALVVP